jgi:hypothetical protein
MNPVTFARIAGGEVHTVTYYLPNSSDVDAVMRRIAASVYKNMHLLRMANVDQELDLVILVPTNWIPPDLQHDYREGLLLGEKWRLCDDIEQPMLAFELELRDLP